MSPEERTWRSLARRHRALGLIDTAAEHDLEADLRALWDSGTPLDLSLSAEVCGWSAVAALAGEEG